MLSMLVTYFNKTHQKFKLIIKLLNYKNPIEYHAVGLMHNNNAVSNVLLNILIQIYTND